MKTRVLCVLAFGLTLTACGSGGGAPKVPTAQPARTYRLSGFQPAGTVTPGKPVTVSFTIDQPNGQPLTAYKQGPGPHTGIHLIMVRDDLAAIIHRHPPVQANGKTSETVVFPAPGKYRVVIDAYPKTSTSALGQQGNFQLFNTIHVGGKYVPQPLPKFKPTTKVDGYTFALHGNPKLKAIQAAFLTMTVTDPNGKPAHFTPWFGALAHAIFFRAGSLDYFHTHVCAPGATGCTSFLGASQVAGQSSTPGKLRVGVLVPVAGTWRLFLQSKVNGHVLTAPFTLEVK